MAENEDRPRKRAKRLSLGGVALQQLQANDDAAEKEAARKASEQEPATGKTRKKVLAPLSGTAAQQTRSAPSAEFREQYYQAMDLYTKNKITTKNTWSLKLIDHIDEVFNVDVSENTNDNFQKLSATLDASVKIYSSRVDSVHGDTFRMLGGLSRTKETADRGGEDEDGVDEVDKEQGPAVPKRPTKVTAVNTLEQNISNINHRKLEMEYRADPLFMKTSASFDNPGGRSLLLNLLSVHNGCEIIFDSADAVTTGTRPDDSMVDVTALQEMLTTVCANMSKLEICPKYAKFKFSDAQDLDHIEFSEDEEDAEVREEIENTDMDAQERALEDELRGLEGPPLVAFDSSQFMDESQPWNAGFDDATQPDGAISRQAQKNFARVLQNVEVGKNADYTFFNDKALENWAGPAHWKFKTVKGMVYYMCTLTDSAPKTTEGDGDEEGEAATKKTNTRAKNPKRKATASLIDFTSPNKKKKEEIEKLLVPGDGKTLLSETAIQKQISSAHNLLLPTDTCFDPSEFTKLFNQPLWSVPAWTERKRWEEPAVSGHSEWNDEFGGGGDGDGFDNEGMGGFDYSDEERPQPNMLDMPITGPLALIDKPAGYEKITVKYATKANHVDVKALKHKMWKELCTEEETHKVKNKPPTEKSFQKMIGAMPEHVPADALPNISVPYYFICLLHLANEKNLEIEQIEGDLRIKSNV